MTNSLQDVARPPVHLALSSLLRADTAVLLRNKVSTFVGVLLPVVLLIVTTLGKGTSKLGSAEMVIGLALTLGLITSSLLGYSMALSHDRETGVLQRLRVTPVPTWTIMASRLIVQVIASLIASVIVIIVGVITHGLTLNIGRYALMLAAAALGSAVFLALGQALVGLVKSATAVSAIGRLLFVVLVLLGLLGVTGILGDTMQTVSEWSPVGALMTLFTDALSQPSWASQDTYSLVACVGYVAVFAFIGIRWFRWESH